jgi:hypothetical protein
VGFFDDVLVKEKMILVYAEGKQPLQTQMRELGFQCSHTNYIYICGLIGLDLMMLFWAVKWFETVYRGW